MTKKVIGYQIVGKNHELPNGLFSFQIFGTPREAYSYWRHNCLKFGRLPKFHITAVREGDIENPIYIH